MIPSDVVSRLQLTADAAVTRVPTPQQVTDALADLVPGQRVLAEIQALLPNGAYRALINQRDVTLALPFSAKAGDSLELEVVESEGKLTLAVVARKGEAGATPIQSERPAVETTFSRTGNFIAGLLGRGEDGDTAKPAPLNANQPIAATPPTKGSELVPLLKQAITQSGMFYESHQAQWVISRLPTEALLAEPQGKLSQPLAQPPSSPNTPVVAGNQQNTPTAAIQASIAADASATPADMAKAPSQTGGDVARAAASTLPPGQLVAPDLVPLVQQQLEALASQTYVWHGQAWPGQPMQWEIEENGHRNSAGVPDAQTQWQTRLTLTMPELGEVKAAIRLNGGEIALTLSAAGSDSAVRLANGGDQLRSQFEAAGLALSGFSVGRHERTEG